jgi:hypothetical protein
MNKVKDISGNIYGKLLVVNYLGKKKWLCKCLCGKTTIVRKSTLVNGNTKSCGCGRIRHGEAREKTYLAWQAMKARCLNKNSKGYYLYGGRGITVCDRWLDKNNGYLNFKFDLGEKPTGKSLDRIDVNGNYEPSNCRWATSSEQQNNRRDNQILTLNDESHTVVWWSNQTGLDKKLIRNRTRRGWSDKKTLTTKTGKYCHKKITDEQREK